MSHETSAEARPVERVRTWPAALLLPLAVVACYANSFAVPFLFDDPLPETHLDYTTRPIVWASFALNRALGGSLFGYHVFNALVHLASGFLLLGILRRTIERVAPQLARGTQNGLALVTTLAWLCHPLQTEAVTYLSQRAEALGAFFLLACLYAFLRSVSSARPRVWQAVSLTALAVGFTAKETILVAPVLVLLYDATFVEQGVNAAVRTRKEFYKALLIVTVVSCFVFVVHTLLIAGNSAGFGVKEHGPIAYARSQPAVVLHYLRLAVWPHPLVFDYGWPVATTPGEYLPQMLVVLALVAGTVVLLLRRSWIGFASAWFFVNLAPSSSIVPIKDLAFEHRVYLPLAGVLLLLVVGGWWLVTRTMASARAVPVAVAAALLLALGAATVQRNQEYRSPIGLWQTVVARAPQNPRGYGNLAHELIAASRDDAGKLDEAIAALRTAVQLDPGYHAALNRLGNAHRLKGEWDLAIEAYLLAIQGADLPAYRYGLASAFLGEGAFDQAETCYRKALELEPEKAENHLGLANALSRLDRGDEALREYREALRLDPGLQDAHTNLAVLLQAQGNAREALEHHKQALAIPPNTIQEQFNLGQCLLSLGMFDEALKALRTTLRLAPAMPEAQAALAKALLSKSAASPEEKAEALQLALKANETVGSKRADILETLAMARAANDDRAAAIALVEQALELPGPTKNAAFRQRLLAQLEQYRR